MKIRRFHKEQDGSVSELIYELTREEKYNIYHEVLDKYYDNDVVFFLKDKGYNDFSEQEKKKIKEIYIECREDSEEWIHDLEYAAYEVKRDRG